MWGHGLHLSGSYAGQVSGAFVIMVINFQVPQNTVNS
jgi:hypothetical protein